MKKKNLTSLALNKKSVANLATQNSVIGGFYTQSCEPYGICCPTQHGPTCHSYECTNECTNGCTNISGCDDATRRSCPAHCQPTTIV